MPTGHAALGEVNEQISALVTSLPTSKEPRRSQVETDFQEAQNQWPPWQV